MKKPKIAVLTGAGISAESGIPTFRDAGGLWEGYNIEDVATPNAWRKNPSLVAKTGETDHTKPEQTDHLFSWRDF